MSEKSSCSESAARLVEGFSAGRTGGENGTATLKKTRAGRTGGEKGVLQNSRERNCTSFTCSYNLENEVYAANMLKL